MSRTALFRKTLLTAGMFAILPCVLPAQEQTAEEARSAGAVSGFSLLDVENESLLRAEFPGHKNWGRVKKGAVLEGRLSLPLYTGEQIAAPADSTIRVTVSSVEKIHESVGFWRKSGRAIVRAFNPLEAVHPTEYRVELSAADLLLLTGEVLPLDARVLRAGSGVMVQPKTKSVQGAGAAQEKSKASGTLLVALRRKALFSVPAEPNLPSVTAAGEQRAARAYMLTALRASLSHAGDTFRAQLAEPVRIGGRVFAPRTGVDGSLSAAEANAQAHFALDEEGTLHGRKSGMVNGLVDLGYAYALGKVSDDISETPIRAIGASMSDAAVANASRYLGLGTSLAFLLTRHGRDVYLPKYALIEIDFGRVSGTAAAANRD